MDDLISRQAAIETIGILLEQSEDDEHDKTWNNAIRSSINAVKHHLPSAQPEPLTEIDAVKREDVVDILHRIMQGRSDSEEDLIGEIVSEVDLLPLVQPYTEDEIQKMQDLEQAQLDKAFELGKQAAQSEIIRCRDCKCFAGEGMYCDWDIMVQYDHFYCYHAERRTDEQDDV